MESKTEKLVVELERLIKAPAARVWSVISSVEGMREWLGPKTFENRAGGRVLFDVLHGEHEDGSPQRWLMFGNVTKFEEDRELAFTWQEFDVNTLAVWPAPTVVSVSLDSAGENATKVTLRHRGFELLPDAKEQYAGYRQGWASLNDLESLARMCEEQS